MKLIDVTRKFQTENSCLDYIEQMRWPNGELGCVHCGEVGRISKITREAGKNKRTRIYQCWPAVSNSAPRAARYSTIRTCPSLSGLWPLRSSVTLRKACLHKSKVAREKKPERVRSRLSGEEPMRAHSEEGTNP